MRFLLFHVLHFWRYTLLLYALCHYAFIRDANITTAWNNINCGDLNLAHERCRWIRLPLLQAMKTSWDFKAQVWYMSKTSERSVRLYTRRLVQAEESRKKENLVFYFLNFKDASPSQRGHLKAQWCLTHLSTFLYSSFHLSTDARVLINFADPLGFSQNTAKLLQKSEPKMVISEGFHPWCWNIYVYFFSQLFQKHSGVFAVFLACHLHWFFCWILAVPMMSEGV